jgi:hypothetical protein
MGRSLAKHGYTVEGGYFQGTCRGSHRTPVQFDRSLTDSTIADLGRYARERDIQAEDLKAGTVTPAKIKTGDKLNRQTYTYDPIYIQFHQGTADQQQNAVKMAIARAESDAIHARAHAKSLKKMADELHGTPLVTIADMPQSTPAPQATVDVKAARVHGAFVSKVARKRELEKLNRAYQREVQKIQTLFLLVPHDQRTAAQAEVYDSPHDLHHWRAKHSAAALKEFPQAKVNVDIIEALVNAREAVKAAP